MDSTQPRFSPQRVSAIYTKGKQLLECSKHRDAAVVFRLMVYVAPADERGWLGLGLCHEGLNQELVARELYSLGASATSSAKCFLACARLLARSDQSDLAQEQFEKAIHFATEREEWDIVSLATKEKELCYGN